MITNRPIKSKSVDRMLSILPPEFDMVSQKNSNGYKFINLLYGSELDFAWEKLEELYADCFLTTFDFANNFDLYSVDLSGISDVTYLNSSGNRIKITDEFEFFNGSPTRITLSKIYNLDPSLTGIVGLQYFRTDEFCSGLLYINLDRNQKDSYLTTSGVSYKIKIDNVGTLDNTFSGFFTGIKTQSFEATGYEEIIESQDPYTFSGRFPLSRRIQDVSGNIYTIDHYEPYLGWAKNELGVPVAIVNYSGQYYYDSEGKKVFYRTAMNNPYGFNNYTSQYFTLQHTPISGTLKVYDIDILDASGNATEIPQNGRDLFYLKSSKMLNGELSGQFDPVYMGYDQHVPSGMGFGDIEGDLASNIALVSWDYQREGSQLNPDSRLWIEPASGNITNIIKINNPHSRFKVEYKWAEANKTKYITSINANRQIHFETENPIFSIENLDSGLAQVDYNFTKDPSYVSDEGNFSTKVLTFDGWDIRPFSNIYRVDLNIPIVYYPDQNLNSFVSINTTGSYAGYTNEFIPVISNSREYAFTCYFNSTPVSGDVIETEIAHNKLMYLSAGANEIYLINFDDHYGKRLVNNVGNLYFYTDMTTNTYIRDNTHWAFRFKKVLSEETLLLDTMEIATNSYVKVKILSSGKIYVEMDGYYFLSSETMTFGNENKSLIVRYFPDDISPSVPVIECYLHEEQDLGYTKLNMRRGETTPISINSNYLHVYKNCNIDVRYFKIYYEAYYGTY